MVQRKKASRFTYSSDSDSDHNPTPKNVAMLTQPSLRARVEELPDDDEPQFRQLIQDDVINVTQGPLSPRLLEYHQSKFVTDKHSTSKPGKSELKKLTRINTSQRFPAKPNSHGRKPLLKDDKLPNHPEPQSLDDRNRRRTSHTDLAPNVVFNIQQAHSSDTKTSNTQDVLDSNSKSSNTSDLNSTLRHDYSHSTLEKNSVNRHHSSKVKGKGKQRESGPPDHSRSHRYSFSESSVSENDRNFSIEETPVSSHDPNIQAQARIAQSIEDFESLQEEISVPLLFIDARLNILHQFAREYIKLRARTSKASSIIKKFQYSHFELVYRSLRSMVHDVDPPFVVNASSPDSPALLLTLFHATLKSRSKKIRNVQIALPHLKENRTLSPKRFEEIVKATFSFFTQVKLEQGIREYGPSEL